MVRSVILSTLVLFSLFSCTKNSKDDQSDAQTFTLSDAQIIDLLKLIASDEYDGLNFHVSYYERFNDSTMTLMVAYNNRLPDVNLNFCKALSFNTSNVFIYDETCKNKIPTEFQSLKGQNPFYVPGSFYWTVLVKRRKEGIDYFNVVFFQSTADQEDLEFEDDPMH